MHFTNRRRAAARRHALRSFYPTSRNCEGLCCEQLEQRRLLASWIPVAPAPAGIGSMVLLTDGTVMAQRAGVTNQWYRLTADASGNYNTGTWSNLANMSLQRLYTATNVLQDGRVYELGGEYSGPNGTANWTNTAEIYNPVTNTWTPAANHPNATYGDVPSMLLSDGRVLTGSLNTAACFIYNPTTNTWTPAGTKLNNDRSVEETWVKLRDDSVLSYNIFGAPGSAQRYIPSTNTWVPAGTSPVTLHTSPGSELGAAVQIPDGRVVQIGGTPNNALYNLSTNTWSALPVTPGGIGGNDSPGALLPDGRVLYAAGDTSTNFNPPTSLFIMDAVNNAVTPVSTAGGPNLTSVRPYNTRMLVLPDGSGDVLFTTGSNQLWIYRPDGTLQDAWRPSISTIATDGSGTYTLTGSQLNGISCGASYGDDAEMDENYPVIRLTNAAGNVFFARSFNWDKTGIGITNGATSVQFVLPAAIATTGGAFKVEVFGAGIASKPVLLVLAGSTTTANLTLRADPGNSANVQALGGATSLGSFPATQFTSAIVIGASNANSIFLVDNYAIANTFVSGGGGSDNLIIDASADTAAATWTIDDNSASRAGFAVNFTTDVEVLTLSAGSGGDSINVNVTTNPLIVRVDGSVGFDIITVQGSGSSAPVTIFDSPGNDNVNVNSDNAGTASVEFDASATLGTLTIGNGGTAIMAANGNNLLSLLGLAIGGTGTLDLFDNDLMVTPGNLATVQALINNGRGGGTWTGNGITSTTARNNADQNTTLGAMTGFDYLAVHGGPFDGQTVAANAVVVKYTYYGDTDFNGKVNFDDYVKADNGFNNHLTGWVNGDFDGNGVVNFDDYVLIDLAFNTQGSTMRRRR
jgi:hypothetical protein